MHLNTLFSDQHGHWRTDGRECIFYLNNVSAGRENDNCVGLKLARTLKESENGLFEDSVSLNPSFPGACSALIGQMTQSVMIGLPLTVCVRNETPITIPEFQLWRNSRAENSIFSTCRQHEPNSVSTTTTVFESQSRHSQAAIMQICYIVTYVTGSETGIADDSFQQFRNNSFF